MKILFSILLVVVLLTSQVPTTGGTFTGAIGIQSNQNNILKLNSTGSSYVWTGLSRNDQWMFAYGLTPDNNFYIDRNNGSWNPSTFIIDRSNGNIGIGTGIPLNALHIEKNGTTRLRLTSTSESHTAGILFYGARPNSSATSSHYIGADGAGSYHLAVSADENILFKTNAVQRMIVGGNGNVGIGTPSTNYRLEVKATTGLPSIVAGNGNLIGFKRTDGALVYGMGHVNGEFTIGASTNLGPTAGTAMHIATGGTQTPIRFSLGSNNEVMRLTNNGNLGIGTISPTSKLEVVGDIEIGSEISNDDTWGAFKIKKVEASENYASFGFINGTSTSGSNIEEALVIQRRGDVGIGTNNPSKKLSVNSGAISDIALFGNNNGSFVFGQTSALTSLDLAASNAFRIRQGSSEAYRISADGHHDFKSGNITTTGQVNSNNLSTQNISRTIGGTTFNTALGSANTRVLLLNSSASQSSLWWAANGVRQGAIDSKFGGGLEFWANNGTSWRNMFGYDYNQITHKQDVKFETRIGIGAINDSFDINVHGNRSNIQIENTDPNNWSFLRFKGTSSKFWDIALYGGNEFLEFRPQGSSDNRIVFKKDGSIEAEKIKVTSSPGADFVFEDDYDLKTLSETEKFIKENKHLPEIPSAKDMKENGLDMSEFQIKLLQKIEELTLHTIRQQKEIDQLKKKLAKK